MKIYEFENLLDNGITTFEFEITKDVNYFFMKKQKKNLYQNCRKYGKFKTTEKRKKQNENI